MPQHGHGLRAGKAAGDAVLDRRHDRIIEAVGVEMDEEPIELVARHPFDRPPRRLLDADLADRREVDRQQVLRQRLAARLAAGPRGRDSRTPTTSSARTSGAMPSMSVSFSGPCPVASARSIDAASPFGSASGWKKSAWPSMKSSPYRPRRLSASVDPSRIEQSPPRTTGKSPASSDRADGIRERRRIRRDALGVQRAAGLWIAL